MQTMNTENLARAYYRTINSADIDALLKLFATDAVFTLPDGRQVEGIAAIRQMYTGVFAQGGPQPHPIRIVPGADAVAAEVEVRLADGSVLNMASFFEIDGEGKFTSVGVYRRG